MDFIFDCTDEYGFILTSDALQAGASKAEFYKFIRENAYEQVAHGVYALPDTEADERYLLSLRCANAVFSHEEALYHYGLLEHEPQRRTVTVYTGYGTGKLIQDGVKVFTVKQELLDVGKTTVKTPLGHEIPMYDLERTICDLVRSRRHFEVHEFQTALKAYVNMEDRNVERLMRYAELFRVGRKMKEYMEILL